MAKQSEPSTTTEPAKSNDARFFLDAGGSWLRGWAALNDQMVAFIGGQMQQHAEACQALVGAAPLPLTMARQAELGRTALRQYLDTSQKLLSLGTDVMVQSWTAMRQATEALQRTAALPLDPAAVTPPRESVKAPRAEAA